MNTIPITILYAGLYGLMMAVLSIRVSFARVRLEVPFGHGGDDDLHTRMRIFGNFTEYVPMILILFLTLELAHTRPLLLHGLGTGLLFARLLHVVSIKVGKHNQPWRRMGRFLSALGTWLILVAMSLLLIKPYILQ